MSAVGAARPTRVVRRDHDRCPGHPHRLAPIRAPLTSGPFPWNSVAPYHEMLHSASVPENYFDERDRDAVRHDLGRPVRAGGRRPGGELPRRSRRDRRRPRARHRHRSHRAPAQPARRPRARDRAVAGDGRAAPGEAGRGRHRRDRSATSRPPTVDGTFTLAYLVRNTITNLTTQDEQVACFRNVAAHLEPGGCFVIEVLRPGAAASPAGRDHPPVHRDPDASRLRGVRRRVPDPRSPTTTG